MSPKRTTFVFHNNKTLTFPKLRDGEVGLPISVLQHCYHTTSKIDWGLLGADVINKANKNHNNKFKELLTLYYKLTYFNIQWIQHLTRNRRGTDEPVLATKFLRTKNINVEGLQCTECNCEHTIIQQK